MRRGAHNFDRRPGPGPAQGRRAFLRMAGTAVTAALIAGPVLAARSGDGPLVFAAASLTDALTEIAQAFTAQTGIRAQFSFAASSTLARQIEYGAPASVFISANRLWMDRLEEAGMVVAASRSDIAGNRLAVIAPAGAAVPADFTPSTDLETLLGDGRLAVADPDHVPAGIYARSALQSLGLWQELQPRLARSGDVRGALALVARGETPLGIVYASDAEVTDRVRVVALLPTDSHPPIAYPAALTTTAGDDARAFLPFLHSPAAQAIFRTRGFSAPQGGGL